MPAVLFLSHDYYQPLLGLTSPSRRCQAGGGPLGGHGFARTTLNPSLTGRRSSVRPRKRADQTWAKASDRLTISRPGLTANRLRSHELGCWLPSLTTTTYNSSAAGHLGCARVPCRLPYRLSRREPPGPAELNRARVSQPHLLQRGRQGLQAIAQIAEQRRKQLRGNEQSEGGGVIPVVRLLARDLPSAIAPDAGRSRSVLPVPLRQTRGKFEPGPAAGIAR